MGQCVNSEENTCAEPHQTTGYTKLFFFVSVLLIKISFLEVLYEDFKKLPMANIYSVSNDKVHD